MEIKSMECLVGLTVSQWGEVLKCLKKNHSDAKLILALEKCMRVQMDQAVDSLYKDVFGVDDPNAVTQEFPVLAEDEPSTISLMEEPEENGLVFDEGDHGTVVLSLMGMLCLCFLGLVATVTIA